MRKTPAVLRALGLLSALLLTGAGAGHPGAHEMPANEGSLRLEVDLSKRVLQAYVDDELVGSYPVAIGQPSYPTPTGSFHVGRVVWNPSWVPPDSPWASDKEPTEPGDPDNPMGRVKMYFVFPDYYIHSTPFENSLGRAESHGCIRMLTSDAIEVAQMVMKYGGAPRDESWFDNVLSSVRTTQVDIPQPIPLSIHS